MFSSMTPTLLGGSSRLMGVEVCKRVTNPNNARHMATLKDIKLRIKSVSSIAKLTKTMQMVASSKLRNAQRKVDASRPAAESLTKVFGDVATETERGNNLVIAVTSDKGMCGAINNQVARHAKSIVRTEKDPAKMNVAVTGGKAASSVANEFPNQMTYSLRDLGKKDFNFVEVGIAVDEILAKANYESVNIIYNKFKNALTYIVTEKRIPGPQTLLANRNKFVAYEFDEDDDATFRDLFEYQIAMTLWGALMENRASELAARMSSMDNATKNATSIISLLGIQYNRGRQASITTELIEITSGASALEVDED